MSMIYNEATFKLILIGDSGTGKSCLLLRFVKDIFDAQHSVTIGVEFATKSIKIDQNYGVKLQIWDTAGQESFRSLVKSFYRNSSAVGLIYDITKKSTFESLSGWMQQALECSPEGTIFILIGTHLDEEQLREVSYEEAEQFQMKSDSIVLFFQTSAKSAQNVDRAFEELGKQLFIKITKNRSPTKKPELKDARIQLSDYQADQDESQKKGCC